jgi:4-amino-4-deoxy-L-arabinose transferase-like glycosyltransferase
MVRIPRKWLVWIIVIAVSSRLLSTLVLKSWEVGDRREYGFRDGAIASSLASGHGFSWPANSQYNPNQAPEPTAWQPPVYPVIMAAVFKGFGIFTVTSKLILIIIQTIIAAASCFVIFLVGRKTFNDWVGLAAALMYAVYPPALHFTVQKIAVTNLIVLLLLLFINQILKVTESPGVKNSLITGAILGALLLCDPTMAAFLPFTLGWLLFNPYAERKIRIINIALVLSVLCLMIIGWQIRNYVVFRKFVFIKSNFSRELFLGNYGDTNAFSEEYRKMKKLDEGQRSELYQRKIIDAMKRDPARLLNNTFKRIVRYWTEIPINRSEEARISGMKDVVVGISYLVLIVFGTAGLILTRLRGKEVQLLCLAVLSLPIPYYLTWFTRFRYRFPVEIILIVFGSYTIYRIYDLVRMKMTLVSE